MALSIEAQPIHLGDEGIVVDDEYLETLSNHSPFPPEQCVVLLDNRMLVR